MKIRRGRRYWLNLLSFTVALLTLMTAGELRRLWTEAGVPHLGMYSHYGNE